MNKVPVDLGDDGIWNRYGRKFPKHPPPAMAWHGEPAALEALMEQAIRDGKPLTSRYLLKVQGLKDAPPGAKT